MRPGPVIAGSFPKARKHHQNQSGRALGKYTCASEHHQRQLPRPSRHWGCRRTSPASLAVLVSGSRIRKHHQHHLPYLEAGIDTNQPGKQTSTLPASSLRQHHWQMWKCSILVAATLNSSASAAAALAGIGHNHGQDSIISISCHGSCRTAGCQQTSLQERQRLFCKQSST